MFPLWISRKIRFFFLSFHVSFFSLKFQTNFHANVSQINNELLYWDVIPSNVSSFLDFHVSFFFLNFKQISDKISKYVSHKLITPLLKCQCFLLFLGFHVRLKFHRFVTSFKRNIELDSGERFFCLSFHVFSFFFFKISNKFQTKFPNVCLIN